MKIEIIGSKIPTCNFKLMMYKWSEKVKVQIKLKLLLSALMLVILTLCINFISSNNRFSPIESQYGIFSWSHTEVVKNKEQMINDLVEYEIDRIYQSFSSRLTDEQIESFVSDVTSKNINVYSLIGTPEWSLDPAGKEMIEELNRVERINRNLSKNQQIKGLIVDVEPYVMDSFNWEDKSVQTSYISSIKQLYQATEQKNLELIVVVPYFFETKGYADAINVIVSEAATEIAVMNYYRDQEIKHVEYEAIIAKKVNKPITTIYEFKRPGDHGLTVKNTYYHEGLAAVKENEDRLKTHFKDQQVNIAYHDYQAFKEVIKNE